MGCNGRYSLKMILELLNKFLLVSLNKPKSKTKILFKKSKNGKIVI